MEHSRTNIYRRIVSYTVQFWPALIVAVLGFAVTAGMSSLIPVLLQNLLDKGFDERDAEFIRMAPFLMLSLFFLRSIGSYLGTYYIGKVGCLVVEQMRNQMFQRMLTLPASFTDLTTTGSLIAKFTFDVERVSHSSSKSLTILVQDSLVVVFSFAVMLHFSWQLAIVLLVVVPPIAVLVNLASSKFRRIGHRIQNSIGEITHKVEQAFSGLMVVKTFGKQSFEEERFNQLNQRNRKNQVKLVATKAVNTPVVQLLVGVAFSLVIYMAFKPEWVGELTPGQFSGFVAAVMTLLSAAKRLTQVNERLQTGIAGAESVFALLDQPIEEDSGTRELKQCEGRVRFENVQFAYNSSDEQVLNNVNFTAEPGQMIALVGRSGSGKSTLVKLIPRFYNLKQGRITIDDVPIQDLTLTSLRHHIAIVNQDVLLFNDTILNNIRYARPEASMEQVLDACRAAHLLDVVEQLPKGFESEIGDKGVRLSGGQRQRIAIARALLKQAQILILDEATSALDTETERAVQSALEHLMRGRTTFVVAHRLSTVEKADRILVLDSGRIVESGNHASLINNEGLYSNLYRSNLDEQPASSLQDDDLEFP